MELVVSALDDNGNVIASETVFYFEIDQDEDTDIKTEVADIVHSMRGLVSDEIDFLPLIQEVDEYYGL